MAFPYVFESNFETGDNSEWDSEADTASQLDFPHYTDLARSPDSNSTPFLGAYCMRAVLSGGTADAYVQEGDLDIAADTTRHFRFGIWFSGDFDATADDTVNVFELQSTGPANEITFGFRYVASTDVINFGIGELAPTSFTDFAVQRNAWYTVEIQAHLDDGGTNDGTIDLFVTKEGEKPQTAVAATQVASLDQAAVIQGRLGVQDHLATTTGTILFDQFAMDDERLYPLERFPIEHVVTKSGQIFVGPGYVQHAALLTNGGSNILRLWDNDTTDAIPQQGFRVELDQDQQAEFGGPAFFRNGCYAQLTGTNPRAQVGIVTSSDDRHVYGPKVNNPARMKQHALR